jgi:hypothetical protein
VLRKSSSEFLQFESDWFLTSSRILYETSIEVLNAPETESETGLEVVSAKLLASDCARPNTVSSEVTNCVANSACESNEADKSALATLFLMAGESGTLL